MSSEKITDLVKVFCDKKPIAPGSWKYSTILNWKKTVRPLSIGKAERRTEFDLIIAKAKKSPGPQSYKPKPPLRATVIHKIPDDRQLKLFDEMKYLSMQSPGSQ